MICVCRSPSIYSLNWNLCSKLPMLLAQNPKVLSRLFIISTKILKIFHGGAPWLHVCTSVYMFLEYRWTSSSIYKELLLIIVPSNAHLYIIIYLFDFVKRWPLGFRLAPDAARLQASAVSIVLGVESQGLGTKDILSIGPVDTHWSHVYINSVRY